MSSAHTRSAKASAASLIDKARARKKDREDKAATPVVGRVPAQPQLVTDIETAPVEKDADTTHHKPKDSTLVDPVATEGETILLDKPVPAGSRSRGRSLLQSALAKKRGGTHDQLTGRSASSGDLITQNRTVTPPAEATAPDSVPSDISNMLELSEETDFADDASAAGPVNGSSAPSTTPQPTRAAARDATPALPKQSVFGRLASLTGAPTESCVHVCMTDYTNPLLELPPLPVRNPCALLRMPVITVGREAKEMFSDAAIDVETIAKSLQGLVKSGSPEAFQLLFSRAAKLVHNARSGGAIQQMLAESGLCQQLVSLIATRMSERPVISGSLDFILDMCTDKKGDEVAFIETSVAAFISAGVVKALVDVLQKYAVHEAICEHAMDVLSLMVISPADRALVGASGACAVCCTVLRENMTSYTLVRKTCVVLMCLAQDKPSSEKLIEAGAVFLLLRLISSCGETSEAFPIWSFAFSALSDMACHGTEDTQSKLSVSHFFPSFFNLLAKLKLDSSKNVETLVVIIYAFCRLYTIPSMRGNFKHENMCNTLHTFAQRHIDCELAISNICLALAVLFYIDEPENIVLTENFCAFYTKLFKKYRSSSTEPYVVCCIYELLVKLPAMSLEFHKEKLTPELVSALVHAVDLERDLSTRRCDQARAVKTTLFSTNLCGTFYAMAAHSALIRRDLVEKINACSCFVAFLTLIHGRAAMDAQELNNMTAVEAAAAAAVDSKWFDRNNDLLFSSCLSCIAVMYFPMIYSAQEFMTRRLTQSGDAPGCSGRDITASTYEADDFQLSAPVLLSESNYLSLITILPHFWASVEEQGSRGAGPAEGMDLQQRRIEMLCWVMYHLSVACPIDRMYTIREKCIGLIRYANQFAISNFITGSWRCVVPFSYLLLSCCVDAELTEELMNMKIFSTFNTSYARHADRPDALCTVLYVISELIARYDRFRGFFCDMFATTVLLKDIVASMDRFRDHDVLTYNVSILLARTLSYNNSILFPMTAQLTDSGLKIGDIIAAGIDRFADNFEVMLSLFHLTYCICPEYSASLGASGVPEAMCRFFAKGCQSRRLAVYSCLALSGLCVTPLGDNYLGGEKRSTKLDAYEPNQNVLFSSYACVFISSLLTEYRSDNKVLEAAAIAATHLTKLRKRVRLDKENTNQELIEKAREKEPAACCASKLVELGCVDAFLEILRSKLIDTELLVRTCGAVRGLCLADFGSTLSRLEALRSSEIFVGLLNAQGANIPAMCAICDVTECLASIASHSHTLQSFGIRQTLNVAAVVNGGNPVALKAIIGLLVALIKADPMRSLLDANDCSIFVNALKRHPSYPPLLALAGWGVSCVAKVAHRDEALMVTVRISGACDVIADCLRGVLDMSKRRADNCHETAERQLFETHAKSIDSIEGIEEEMEYVFDPTERLADAVSGLSAACSELAGGEMHENRLRLQSKSIVSVLCQLVAAFAVVRRTSKAPIGSFALLDFSSESQANLSISSRCSESLCHAVAGVALLDSARDAFIVGGICEDVLDVLFRHLEGESTANAALCALRQLVVSQQGNVGSIRLISQKACIIVHKALLRHIHSSRNVLSTLWLMKLLALVASGREDFAELNITDAVMLAMETHRGNADVVAQALWVFRNLGSFDMKRNLDQMCRNQCAGGMVAALASFPNDHELAEAACAAVQMICRYSASVKEFLIDRGLCGLLAGCAAGGCQSASSVVHCLQTIRELGACTSLLPTVISDLTTAKLHDSLVALMLNFADSNEVAEHVLHVILILLRHDASYHSRMFTEVTGCSEHLTSLILRYVSFELIACLGSEVVLLLCKSGVAMSQMAHAGAPAAIITALQHHESNGVMCRLVCRAVACFCEDSADNTVNLSLRGVCEVIVQMLQRHELTEDLIIDILRAALVVANENDVCKRRFFDYDIGNSLLKLLEVHATNIIVIGLCCRVVISLTSNPYDFVLPSTELRNLGITFKLDALITQHIHDEALCELCCIAMTSLLVDDPVDAKVEPSVQKSLLSNAVSLRNILNGHVKNTAIVVVCCEGLALIAARLVLLPDLGTLSICEAVLKAWRAHNDVDEVVHIAAIAVALLARTDANRSRLAFNDLYSLAVSSITLRGVFEKCPVLLAEILFAVNETTRGHAENADVFLGGGFFEVVASNLGSQKNVTVLRAACDCVDTIVALKPELSMLFGNAGACGFVTRILHHLSGLKNDPEIKSLCSSSLRATSALSVYKGNLVALQNANLFGALESVLSSFPDNLDAGVWSCNIIRKFLTRGADDFVPNQTTLGSLRICQKILFCAMDKSHRDTTGLADLFSALTDLTFQHAGNIGQLLGADAIKQVVSMVHNTSCNDASELTAFNTDIMATSNCCELLGTLCFLPAAQDKIREAHGCAFVVSTMRYVVNKRHVECTMKILNAIDLITRNSPRNQDVFAYSEVIPSLVVCLEGWLESVVNEEIALVVMNVLCNCQSYDDNANIFSKVESGVYNMTAVSSLRMAGAFESVFSCMGRNIESHTLLTQGCWALNSFAADRDCISRLGSSGGCDAIVVVLGRFGSKKLNLLKAASNAMSSLCDQMANSMALGTSVVYDTLYSYLLDLWTAYEDRVAVESATQVKFYAEELDVLFAVSKAMVAMSREALKTRFALADRGVCDLLPKLLAAIDDAHVACSLCKSMCILIQDIPENVILFENAEVIQVILGIFRKLINSPDMYSSVATPAYIVAVCNTLNTFLTGNPVLGQKTAKLGGCHSIIEMSNKYRSNKFIMVECSSIVRLLGSTSEENSMMFTETGAWDVAIDILTKHDRGHYITSKDSLNPSATAAAAIPPKDSTDVSLEEWTEVVVFNKIARSRDWATGACSALVEALRNHMSSVAATQQNCAAIARLAANDPENAIKFAELGLVESLAGLLRKHLGASVPILVEVLNCIHALCFRTPAVVPHMLQLGLCEATCIAYRRHHNDAGIALAATKAIFALSINEEMSSTLGVAGACQSVNRSLQESIAGSNSELVEICCRAMTRLIKGNIANHEQFTTGGACQQLASALGMYMTDISSVLEAILWAVAVMCRYSSSSDSLDDKNCTIFLELHVDSSLVYVLSCFGNAPEIMEAVCTAISHLCYNEAAAEGFGGLGTCKVLVDLTKAHLSARNFPILVPTVSALANMSPVPQNVEMLLQYGVLENLTSIIKSQANLIHTLPSLVDSCCVCLKNLCKYAKVSARIGELGICEPFYQIINMYQHNSDLGTSCKTLLPNLYSLSSVLMQDSPSNSEALGGFSIALLFLEKLKDCEADSTIALPVLCGCHAVSSVHKASEQLVEGGICQRLVSLLRRYIKRIDIVEHICGTISNVVIHDPANCVLFDECEICDALIACMRRHADTAEVAIYVANTIADLATHEITCRNLGRSGASESVVEALQRFSGNDDVALPACRAISRLALDPDNVEVLCELHAYEWIVSALFLSVENASLITCASTALTLLHITFRSGEKSAAVDFRKLCDAFIAILDAHQGCPSAIQSVCDFVKCLADDGLARDMLGTCGAPSRLMRSLELYSDQPEVAKSVLRAIAAVSLKNDANKSAFGEVNVGIAVLETMRAHWKDSAILESALFCITTLSFGNVVNTSTFGTNGACELVLKALAEHAPKSARIAAVGCQAVFCLSKGEGNLERFDICGGVDIVADILDTYITNEKVVRHTCSALAALGQSDLQESGEIVVMTVSECSERVCTLIARAFEIHLSNSAVLRAVVAAIGALAESPVNSRYFCKSEVCGCLVRALAASTPVVQSCAHILSTMEKLAKHDCPAADEFATEKCFSTIVTIFELYSEDPVIHSNGCKLLRHILKNRRDSIANLLLASIVRMLVKFVMQSHLLCDACRLIELICTDSLLCAEACGAVGGARHLCEALEDSLRHHSSDVDVLSGIFRAMLGLCISPQLVMFFASGSNSKILLHSLAVYINDSTLVRDICALVTSLTHDNATNKIEFASIDSIKIMLRALSIHKTEITTVTDICCAVFSLCDNNRDNCSKLVALKGGDTLLELSSIHKTSVTVCGNIFSILSDIILLQKSMLDALMVGGLRLHVITMLSNHPQESKLVYGCVRLLRIMYQIETQEKACLLSGLEGECRLLVNALNVHAKDLSICFEVCGVVSFLGLNEVCAQELADRGACVAIRLRIADASAAVNTKLLQSALLCVTVLCKSSDDVRHKFCEADICRTLMRSLAVPEDKGAVEKLVMSCIPALCGKDSCPEQLRLRMEKLLEADACEHTCAVLEKRLAETNLVVAPCSAAACLARYGPARDALIRLGVTKYLVHVLKEHLLIKPLVAELSCAALTDLCSSKEGHKSILSASDSLVAVSKVLETGPGNISVAIRACELVTSLAKCHGDVGVTLFTLGCCQSVMKILSAADATVESITVCLNAISALCDSNPVVLECFVAAGTAARVVELAWKHVSSLALSRSAVAVSVIFGCYGQGGNSSRLCAMYGPDVGPWCIDTCATHMSDSDICFHVSQLFGVFAKGDVPIMQEFCQYSVQIIVNYVDNDRVATAASECIVHLGTKEDSKPRDWLLAAGASAACINVLRKDATCADVAVQICNVVQFMAAAETENVLISESEACEKVALILDTFSINDVVVQHACKAIVNLVEIDAENEVRLEIFEVCKQLMGCFRRFLNGPTPNLSVCAEICAAIEVMATSSPANLARFSLDAGLMALIVSFLARQFADGGDCTSCCRAITVLAHDPRNSELFGRAGLCDSLTVVLCKNKNMVNYSYYILSAVHSLCQTSQMNIIAMATKKCSDALLSILRDNTSQAVVDDHLTLISMKVLCFLSSIPEARLMLGESGVSRLLNRYLDALVPKDSVSAEILEFTLLVVSTLCNSPENQQSFGGAGTCERVCDVLKKYVDKVSVLRAALSAVANLCDESVSNMNVLCHSGVVQLLIDSLNAHADNALINELVARVLKRLGAVAAKDGSVVAAALNNSSICTLIVAGLRKHTKARNVNRVLCAGIRNLALLSPQLKLQLGADSVCPELCKAAALGLSVSDEELLLEALEACTAVVADSCSNQETMGVAGLCELLADICNEKVECDVVVEKVFSCVAALCRCGVEPITASANNMTRFAVTNLADNVVQVLKTNISSLEAVRMAYVATRNLCANEQNLTRIVGIGGCEAICITLRRLLHNEHVCEAACGALAVLSRSDCYRKLVSLGAIDLITLTLQRYPDNADIVFTASTGVVNLCRDYENKRQFAQKGVCGVISRVLLKLGSNAHVAEEACSAVKSLSENCPENKILLGAAGACEAIVSTLRTHSNNLVVGRAATSALNSLMEGNGTNAKRIADSGGDKLRVSTLSAVEWRTAPGEDITE